MDVRFAAAFVMALPQCFAIHGHHLPVRGEKYPFHPAYKIGLKGFGIQCVNTRPKGS